MSDRDIHTHVEKELLPRDPAVSPDLLILDEAWAIAVDLRADLGIVEAVAWADAYLDEVRRRESASAVARWAVVISALEELQLASVH
ncbi:hypothetical protein [Sphingomonas jatrophae]|jgi:hypothetical protein|uniref:Uncharacterized protein n=1 Tax=Sphingomonas jatrophae TaxID=1166337 RepID=A0A1I6L786_9SPHN|nr:hypothetical protein [Sphingomonas jatrophae]SFR99373.1 hypothetical protein SAMN05192580_2400 [Sphingomonas jatrophae]